MILPKFSRKLCTDDVGDAGAEGDADVDDDIYIDAADDDTDIDTDGNSTVQPRYIVIVVHE